jgi:hypothetical protein
VFTLLVHGVDIVSMAILPIRKLSQEAQESRIRTSSTSEVTGEKYLKSLTNEDVLIYFWLPWIHLSRV